MSSELSDILGGEQQPGSEGLPAPTQQEAATEARQQPARDDGGRFARQETGERQQQDSQQRQDPATPPAAAAPQPSAREQELERQNKWFQESMATMLAGRQRPDTAAPPQKPAEPPEYWVDPAGRTEHDIRGAIEPIQRQMISDRVAFSETLAVMRHGEENVSGAVNALVEHLQRNPRDLAGVQNHIITARDPMGDVIAWHKRQQALSTVGDDPTKWRDGELKRMMSDPAERAKLVEMIQAAEQGGGQQGQAPQQRQQQEQTRVALPPSLSRLPTGRQQVDSSDMSDAALFSHARH